MNVLRFGFLDLHGALVSLCAMLLSGAAALGADIGLFSDERDIGRPAQAGASRYDRATGSYEIRGGGGNMWFTNDAFHFVWKPFTGDFCLSAGIDWLGSGGNPHRKACLIARQNLTPGSPYVDVAVHGDGLTSLQYRELQDGPTREIQLAQKHPLRVALARQGPTFAVLFDPGQGELVRSGAFLRLKLSDPVLLGLGVCAHDNTLLETARFSVVDLKASAGLDTAGQLHCALETVAVASKDRRIVYHTTNHIEAPNWSRDGTYLLFNSNGRICRLPVSGGEPAIIDTGFATRCNNDHGISPDGTQLVVSDQSRTGKSLVYVLPVTGGTPRQVTSLGPSYWHGWSPDGKTLAYCAERNGEYDVYTIPVEGGEETRLTSAKGLDDGPDYSADGKWIYFNSDRTGTMHIWRMRPDGSGQQQLTFDECNNWFPHPSPDGKCVVFLSYEKDVTGHPANKNVWLRLMPIEGGPVQELARLFGGQGTINVPSWSPDSRHIAFVSYELLTGSESAPAQPQ